MAWTLAVSARVTRDVTAIAMPWVVPAAQLAARLIEAQADLKRLRGQVQNIEQVIVRGSCPDLPVCPLTISGHTGMDQWL